MFDPCYYIKTFLHAKIFGNIGKNVLKNTDFLSPVCCGMSCVCFVNTASRANDDASLMSQNCIWCHTSYWC